MRKVLFLALSALLLFAAGSCWLALYPSVPADLAGAESVEKRAERVRIPVGEDDHVLAWATPGRQRALVVLLPGYARDQRRMSRYAGFLREAGYATLAVQFRSARGRDRKPTTLGYWEVRDTRAVLAWIASQPRYAGYRIVLYGESLGASVALVVAAERPEVAAVVADCPFATGRMALEDGFACVYHLPRWPLTDLAAFTAKQLTGHDPTELDVTRALRDLGRRPVLLIQAGVEDRFSRRQVSALEAASGPGVDPWLIADAGHNGGWLVHRRDYETRVRAFLAPVFWGAGAAPPERPAAPDDGLIGKGGRALSGGMKRLGEWLGGLFQGGSGSRP